MAANIDAVLDAAFTSERIVRAFYEYKEAKWDRFSGFDNAEINIPMGADGITYEAFEKQLDRHARNIYQRIQAGRYFFYPFREVDKSKDPTQPPGPKNTRRLGIASIRDAIVQTILYNDVLYEPIERLFRALDDSGPVSFAYRKGKSPSSAARLIHSYAKGGYWYVYDADLSQFFDTIPHDKLLRKLADVIGGETTRTFRLVRRYVCTDRVPHSTYKHEKRKGREVGCKIFQWRKPERDRRTAGVPQGGVLSGLLANLYLHDFDLWVINGLAKKADIRYVRYADDFIVMAKSPEALVLVDHEVRQKLASDDFSLKINDSKTKPIDIRERPGLEFVGFAFDGEHIRIRHKNIEKFKRRLEEEVFASVPGRVKRRWRWTLGWLVQHIDLKVRGLRGKEVCPHCRLRRIAGPRSWIAAFRAVTDEEQIRELDKWIRETLYQYMHRAFGVRIPRSLLRRHGLKSLVNEVYQIQDARRVPCLCEIEDHPNGIWEFAPGLYCGRSFKTLSQQRSFSVPFVGKDELQISVGKRQYRIRRSVLEGLWNRLVQGQTITRVDLEHAGMRNTSHVVALMAQLPGVQAIHQPIAVFFRREQPADFLLKKSSP